jgi:hypothetical protein
MLFIPKGREPGAMDSTAQNISEGSLYGLLNGYKSLKCLELLSLIGLIEGSRRPQKSIQKIDLWLTFFW